MMLLADMSAGAVDRLAARLPRPAGRGPGVVAVAWPTGRPIRPYTADELAAGVDCYTRHLKRVGERPE